MSNISKNVRIPKVNLGTFYKLLKILNVFNIEMIKYENTDYKCRKILFKSERPLCHYY